MTIGTGRRRARLTTMALVASLVGGTLGIEVAAFHLSAVAAYSQRKLPAPAARIERVAAAHDAR
jgi:hypothetical protein